jgi:invasion protein IalB
MVAALVSSGGQLFAQGAVKSVHGDWQIRCDTPPGAQGEQCAMMQSVTAEDRPNVGLTVIVLKTADQKSRLMRVVAPLGVLLPSGLGLKVNYTASFTASIFESTMTVTAIAAGSITGHMAVTGTGVPAGTTVNGQISGTPGGVGTYTVLSGTSPSKGLALASGALRGSYDSDVGRAGFVRCLPNGCIAEVVMDDNLIKELRTGQTSTFIIFQTPEEGIGFPMSLKGFGEGYDQLP